MVSTSDAFEESTQEKPKNVPKVTFSIPPSSQTDKQRVNPISNQRVNPNRLFPMPNSPQMASTDRKKREKVRLAPHHSAMDWERFKQTNNLKNIDPSEFPVRLNKLELAKHNKENDYWMALNGKIYNITSYLNYHPGGLDILVKYAGKDCTALFMKYHRWVNFERILDECFVGFLIS
jgi:cytochrome b involved in lipid metabolism